MLEGEKTFVFWIGLVILGLASVTLFGITWFNILWAIKFWGPYGTGISFETQVPFIVGTVVFILIGIYMMKSGVKKTKETEPKIKPL